MPDNRSPTQKSPPLAANFNPDPAEMNPNTMPSAASNPVSTLTAVAPGPPRVLQSSAHLPWRGYLLEKHLSSPGERLAAQIDRHVLSLIRSKPSRGEHLAPSGAIVPYVKTPGVLIFLPAGPVAPLRLQTPSELLHLAFDAPFLQDVADEMDRQPAFPPLFRTGVHDAPTQRLLNLLLDELEAGAPSGKLYADSLAQALATRFLLLEVNRDSSFKPTPSHSISPLPKPILRRIQQRIEADLHQDLSLSTLAQESSYSRTHFLRMFRVATGQTPHEYLLEQRIRRAQTLLKQHSLSLIDIAAACGFSSHAHMTRAFSRQLGVTPSEYRRIL